MMERTSSCESMVLIKACHYSNRFTLTVWWDLDGNIKGENALCEPFLAENQILEKTH